MLRKIADNKLVETYAKFDSNFSFEAFTAWKQNPITELFFSAVAAMALQDAASAGMLEKEELIKFAGNMDLLEKLEEYLDAEHFHSLFSGQSLDDNEGADH